MTKHTILQLSDMHFVATPGASVYGADPDARLEAALRACEPVLSNGIDLIVLSGDLTDDYSHEAYKRLRNRVDQLGFESIAFAGNHDDATVLAQHFDTPAMVGLGDWHMVCIDTSRPGQVHGTVDVAAAAESLRDLDGPVIVAMHHPPMSPSSRPSFALDHDSEFLALIEASPQVKAIISGHLHEPFEWSLPGGATLFGAPSTLTGAIHEGDTYRNGEGTVTGARVIDLFDNGSVQTRLILT